MIESYFDRAILSEACKVGVIFSQESNGYLSQALFQCPETFSSREVFLIELNENTSLCYSCDINRL